MSFAFDNKTVLHIQTTFSYYDCRLGVLNNNNNNNTDAPMSSSPLLIWIPIENAALLVDVLWASYCMEKNNTVQMDPMSSDFPTVLGLVSNKKEYYLPFMRSHHRTTTTHAPGLSSLCGEDFDSVSTTVVFIVLEGRSENDIDSVCIHVRIRVEGITYVIPSTISIPDPSHSKTNFTEEEETFLKRLKNMTREKQEKGHYFAVKGIGCGGPFVLPSFAASTLFDDKSRLRTQSWSCPELLAAHSGDRGLVSSWNKMLQRGTPPNRKQFNYYGTCFLSAMRFLVAPPSSSTEEENDDDDDDLALSSDEQKWEEMLQFFIEYPVVADTHGKFTMIES